MLCLTPCPAACLSPPLCLLPAHQVRALPEHLRTAEIHFADFASVHQLTRKLHTLSVALEFMTQVGRRA